MRPTLVRSAGKDPSPSSSDGARAALARAIEAARGARAAVTDAEAALSRNAEAIEEAHAQVEATSQSLARHRQQQAVRAADAARVGKKCVVNTVPGDARVRADEAIEARDALLSAHDVLERELGEKRAALAPLEKAVGEAADHVLACEAERLLIEAAAMQEELERRRAVLMFLSSRVAAQADARVGPLLGMVESDEGADPVAVAAWRALDERLTSFLVQGIIDAPHTRAARQGWERARLALMEDPNAELPEH